MKLKKITLATALALASFVGAKAQQVFNLSTGVGGTPMFPTMLAPGVNDDTWTVQLPNLTTVTPRVCATFSAWANSNCSSWISPNIHATTFVPLATAATGTYRYNATVNIDNACIANGVLDIAALGADNTVTGLEVNGTAYTVPAATFNPLTTGVTVNINAADLNAGANTITFIVNNASIYTGFNLCADLTVNFLPNLVPSISGPSSYCSGNSLTFVGSDGPGTATSFMWESVECNSSGVPVSLTNNYTSPGYLGAPGSFTFPALSFTCGKYYRIKLKVFSACTGWRETTHVFYYSCRPTANAGPDQTICEGECVDIGSNAAARATYVWTVGSTVVGNTPLINVCPTVTTTYTLTVTNSWGCSSVDQVTVTVLPNNPSFSLANNTAPLTYYTVTATPNVLSPPPGTGFAWTLQELDPSNNVLWTISNPSVWWSGLVNQFQGFDHTATAYTGTITSLPTTPATGKFLYNRTYRLTRGTWTPDCPWNQFSQIFTSVKTLGSQPVIYSYEDTHAPDFSYLAQQATASVNDADLGAVLRVFPNPSTGVFTLTLNNAAEGTVDVFDIMGKKVQNLQLNANTNVYQIDLTGYAKGIYVINITAGGVTQSKKVVLE